MELARRVRYCLRKLLGGGPARKPLRVISGEEFGEEIPIDSLICPLRYDIVLRIKFLEYYEENGALFARDFGRFMAGAPVQDYLTWYREVYARRFRPDLYRSPRALLRRFRARVKGAVGVHDSIKSSGFDVSKPISLVSATVIRHEHDKKIRARCYAGDGCHRIATLRLLGVTTLPGTHYAVDFFAELTPRDNTSLLLRALPLPVAAYCRFISSYYCDGEAIEDPGEIVEHVRRRNPSRLEEVASVLDEDMKQLRGSG